jgi:5-methyltetrahydrofolate--homocysteine methyltransferase
VPDVPLFLKPRYFAVLPKGKRPDVLEAIQAALDAKIPVDVIINEGMIAAMGEVGRRFESGEFYIPEMLVAARAMQAGMNAVKPYLGEAGIQQVGTVVIGTVSGDLHDIGKNLVSVMLEGAGFKIVDLGTDVPAARFVQAVSEYRPDILAMSALLTTTMLNLQGVVTALEQAGVRQTVKVLVGGAPVTDGFARQIGADGYAPDASRAVSVAKSLVP